MYPTAHMLWSARFQDICCWTRMADDVTTFQVFGNV